MLRASLISLALLVGGGSVAFAEDPMPAEGAGAAQAAPKAEATAPKADAAKPAKHHRKTKARNKKPAAPKKHKHHAKKTK
jgi:hypothetical protein